MLQLQAQAEAMVALVLADYLLRQTASSLCFFGLLPLLFRVFAPRMIRDIERRRKGREEGKSAGMWLSSTT
jgi:hypothetical protein